ncbi:hypothetical protein [Cupriavidus necator]
MSMEQARQDLYTAVEAARAAWPAGGLKLQTENKNLVDRATQTAPYVAASVMFMGGEQASIGAKPLVATFGHLVLGFCAKEDQGTADLYKLADHFAQYVEFKQFTSVRTRSMLPQKAVPDKGWYVVPVLVPFWYHRVAA